MQYLFVMAFHQIWSKSRMLLFYNLFFCTQIFIPSAIPCGFCPCMTYSEFLIAPWGRSKWRRNTYEPRKTIYIRKRCVFGVMNTQFNLIKVHGMGNVKLHNLKLKKTQYKTVYSYSKYVLSFLYVNFDLTFNLGLYLSLCRIRTRDEHIVLMRFTAASSLWYRGSTHDSWQGAAYPWNTDCGDLASRLPAALPRIKPEIYIKLHTFLCRTLKYTCLMIHILVKNFLFSRQKRNTQFSVIFENNQSFKFRLVNRT
jgi:hypothetical protein